MLKINFAMERKANNPENCVICISNCKVQTAQKEEKHRINLNLLLCIHERKFFLLVYFLFSKTGLHRVLGSCGFQWCSFHSCAFSKNSPNIQLMRFSLHKWRNSFTHAFLVTNDLIVAELNHAVFARPKKPHELRTGLCWNLDFFFDMTVRDFLNMPLC